MPEICGRQDLDARQYHVPAAASRSAATDVTATRARIMNRTRLERDMGSGGIRRNRLRGKCRRTTRNRKHGLEYAGFVDSQ